MAEATKLELSLTAFERAWLRSSLISKRDMLIRSRAKELAGSEIWALRGREIEAIVALLARF